MWRNKATKERTLFAMQNVSSFILFDTETTGLYSDKDDRIIELAAIKYNIWFEELDRLLVYIKPPMPITKKIENLTGITNEFLSDKPNEKEVSEKILHFFGNSPECIVAYNTPFDYGFMQHLYKRNNLGDFNPKIQLDVLEMARDLIHETENHKLSTITAFLGLNIGINFHNALDDVVATSRVLKHFVSEYEKMPETNKPKRKLTVTAVNFWEGYKGLSRLYVNFKERIDGKIYYDIRKKVWNCKNLNFAEYDMEDVERQAFKMTNSSNYQEFGKFKG